VLASNVWIVAISIGLVRRTRAAVQTVAPDVA